MDTRQQIGNHMVKLAELFGTLKDDVNYVKYLKLAIECGNSSYAAYCLGGHYYHTKNYPKMHKYLNMADKMGNVNALGCLAKYHQDKKEYDLMLIYYNKAIEKGDIESATSLGMYYRDNKDYENMFKYLNMAIAKGSSNGLFSLAIYYSKYMKDFEKAELYYKMAAEVDKNNTVLVV